MSCNAFVEAAVIPANWVHAAVNFLDLDQFAHIPKRVGADFSGDVREKSVLISMQGPVVSHRIQSWEYSDIASMAVDAYNHCHSNDAEWLIFESSGTHVAIEALLSARDRNFNVFGFAGWRKPSETFQKSQQKPDRKIINMWAECCFLLEERFRKTFEVANGINTYPVEELISIPANPVLINQLTTPVRHREYANALTCANIDPQRFGRSA